MNISRIDSLGNEIGIITTFLLSRKPKKEEYPLPVRMNISRIDHLGKCGNESTGENKGGRLHFTEYWAKVMYSKTEKNVTSYWVINSQGTKISI